MNLTLSSSSIISMAQPSATTARDDIRNMFDYIDADEGRS